MKAETITAKINETTGKYTVLREKDQEKTTESMFGFNNANDYYTIGSSTKYNLSTAIGVKLNVNF